jgi:hypothetical protein
MFSLNEMIAKDKSFLEKLAKRKVKKTEISLECGLRSVR